MARPELLALTSLRAFAAMHVVLYHVTGELGGQAARALPAPVVAFLGCGQSAVSFFFVLSGFILAYTYCDADGGMRGTRTRFWRARFARIYPLYFASFLLDAPRAVGFFFKASPSHAIALTKSAIAAAGYLTLLQSWVPRITNAWNTPGWSLSTEAFFYAMFPSIVLGVRGWSARRIIACGLACWGLLLAVYWFVEARDPSLLESAGLQTAWRSLPPLRLPEFVLGIGIGRLHLSSDSKAVDRWLGVGGLLACLLLVGLFAFGTGLPRGLVSNSLGAPLFAILVLALARDRLPLTRWLRDPAWVLLGRASYAVYILHQPLKTWYLGIAAVLAVPASPALLAAYVLALQVVCIGAFRIIEDPARRFLTHPVAMAAS
jgi:peptidoglycan/LPS O-acetylase OafA/YrhL